MTLYKVWSQDRLSNYGYDIDSLEQLQLLEFETDLSWSSVVSTNDIQQFIESVHNETNVKLSYAFAF